MTGVTFRGFTETTKDAFLLFEACRCGDLRRITQRISGKDRDLIQSGHIFVYDERESGIKRWTDGLIWSPSRISGNFLVYRELDRKANRPQYGIAAKARDEAAAPPGGCMRSQSRSSAGRDAEANDADGAANKDYAGSANNRHGYQYTLNGLMKRTISATVDGVAQHLVCYYRMRDIPYLKRPSQDSSILPHADALDPSMAVIDTQATGGASAERPFSATRRDETQEGTQGAVDPDRREAPRTDAQETRAEPSRIVGITDSHFDPFHRQYARQMQERGLTEMASLPPTINAPEPVPATRTSTDAPPPLQRISVPQSVAPPAEVGQSGAPGNAPVHTPPFISQVDVLGAFPPKVAPQRPVSYQCEPRGTEAPAVSEVRPWTATGVPRMDQIAADFPIGYQPPQPILPLLHEPRVPFTPPETNLAPLGARADMPSHMSQYAAFSRPTAYPPEFRPEFHQAQRETSVAPGYSLPSSYPFYPSSHYNPAHLAALANQAAMHARSLAVPEGNWSLYHPPGHLSQPGHHYHHQHHQQQRHQQK